MPTFVSFTNGEMDQETVVGANKDKLKAMVETAAPAKEVPVVEPQAV